MAIVPVPACNYIPKILDRGGPQTLLVSLLLYPPSQSMYGGYYGLVVVTPRPQTLHRSHDNLTNPYRIATIYFIWILTNSSYKLCFYRLWKFNHRTPFTTALCDVKKVLARGQRATVRSRLPLSTKRRLDTTQTKHHSPILCRLLHIGTECIITHRSSFHHKIAVILTSILPDLPSNRISIASPTISSDILGRSAVLWEILSLVLTHFLIPVYLKYESKIRIHIKRSKDARTYLVPINCTIIVDVQHTFHFYLDLISDPGQGHKKLSFSAYFM